MASPENKVGKVVCTVCKYACMREYASETVTWKCNLRLSDRLVPSTCPVSWVRVSTPPPVQDRPLGVCHLNPNRLFWNEVKMAALHWGNSVWFSDRGELRSCTRSVHISAQALATPLRTLGGSRAGLRGQTSHPPGPPLLCAAPVHNALQTAGSIVALTWRNCACFPAEERSRLRCYSPTLFKHGSEHSLIFIFGGSDMLGFEGKGVTFRRCWGWGKFWYLCLNARILCVYQCINTKQTQ